MRDLSHALERDTQAHESERARDASPKLPRLEGMMGAPIVQVATSQTKRHPLPTMKKELSEVTRRDIRDHLVASEVRWSEASRGRVGAAPRLERDSVRRRTFQDRRRNLLMHRENFVDWEADWVFTDRRFKLVNAPDDEFYHQRVRVITGAAAAAGTTYTADVYARKV